MTVHLHESEESSLPIDHELGRELKTNEITSRMRTGIVWTGGGLLTLGGTILLAAESLIAPGGWSLPVWLWPIPLVMGMAAIGFGFGVMVDESARQQQHDIEAHDAFAEMHLEDDVNLAEFNEHWE